jgi:hypothetical protein
MYDLERLWYGQQLYWMDAERNIVHFKELQKIKLGTAFREFRQR